MADRCFHPHCGNQGEDQHGRHHLAHEAKQNRLQNRWITHPIEALEADANRNGPNHNPHGEQAPNQSHSPGALHFTGAVNHQGQIGGSGQGNRHAVQGKQATEGSSPKNKRGGGAIGQQLAHMKNQGN